MPLAWMHTGVRMHFGHENVTSPAVAAFTSNLRDPRDTGLDPHAFRALTVIITCAIVRLIAAPARIVFSVPHDLCTYIPGTCTWLGGCDPAGLRCGRAVVPVLHVYCCWFG